MGHTSIWVCVSMQEEIIEYMMSERSVTKSASSSKDSSNMAKIWQMQERKTRKLLSLISRVSQGSGLMLRVSMITIRVAEMLQASHSNTSRQRQT